LFSPTLETCCLVFKQRQPRGSCRAVVVGTGGKHHDIEGSPLGPADSRPHRAHRSCKSGRRSPDAKPLWTPPLTSPLVRLVSLATSRSKEGSSHAEDVSTCLNQYLQRLFFLFPRRAFVCLLCRPGPCCYRSGAESQSKSISSVGGAHSRPRLTTTPEVKVGETEVPASCNLREAARSVTVGTAAPAGAARNRHTCLEVQGTASGSCLGLCRVDAGAAPRARPAQHRLSTRAPTLDAVSRDYRRATGGRLEREAADRPSLPTESSQARPRLSASRASAWLFWPTAAGGGFMRIKMHGWMGPPNGGPRMQGTAQGG